MAVDIVLAKPVVRRRAPDLEPGVSFEDDGYYWLLFPFFERLAAETRQFIDPYGDAEFSDVKLAKLEKVVVEARAFATALTDTIEVKLGWRTEPVVETIRKDILLNLLDRLGEVIRVARRESRAVVCRGD